MKTAVLCHTFNFLTEGKERWLNAMVGTPEKPGRIPTAVAAALEFNAESLLVFRYIVVTDDGKHEGEMIRDYMFGLAEEFSKFAPTLPVLERFSPQYIRGVLEGIFYLMYEPRKVNTASEVAAALQIFKERGIDRAIFVSNSDHISRIAQLVCVALSEGGGAPNPMQVIFLPARSLFSGDTMRDVVVFEPPAVEALKPVDPRRLLSLQGNPGALAEVDAVLRKFGV